MNLTKREFLQVLGAGTMAGMGLSRQAHADINSAGQITGFAVNEGSQAFVLTIPAPGATALVSFAGLAALRRRRRQAAAVRAIKPIR